MPDHNPPFVLWLSKINVSFSVELQTTACPAFLDQYTEIVSASVHGYISLKHRRTYRRKAVINVPINFLGGSNVRNLNFQVLLF